MAPRKQPAAKKQPAKKIETELKNPESCPHPPASKRQFGWGTVCGDCGRRRS